MTDKYSSLIDDEPSKGDIITTQKKLDTISAGREPEQDLINEDILKDPLTFLKTIDLDAQNEEPKFDCVMNTNKILNEKVTFYTYSCFACPEMGDNICSDCIRNCHAEHLGEVKPQKEKTVKITEMCCSCAEHGHHKKVIKKEHGSVVSAVGFSAGKCNIIDILMSSANLQSTFYVNKKNNNYYCAFCFKNCIDTSIGGKGYKACSQNEVPKNVSCSCTNKKNHTLSGSINSLQKMLLDNDVEEDINLYQVPGVIIRSKKFCSNLFGHIVQTHETISNLIQSNKICEQPTIISENYLNSMRLLRTFSVRLNSENSYDFVINDSKLMESFNLKFLRTLFTVQDDGSPLQTLQRKQTRSSRKSVDASFFQPNDSFLIPTKTNSLYFFRVFALLPRSRDSKRIELAGNGLNVNPILRRIYRKSFGEFLRETGLEEEEILGLLGDVMKNLERYNEHLTEFSIDERKFSELIIEYFEWLTIFASLKYENLDYKKIYESVILANFNSCVQIIKKIKIEAKRVKSKIAKFSEICLLNNNDIIILDKINNPQNERENMRKKELSEEEADGEKSNYLDDLTYMFKEGELQEMIVNSLFAYKKDPKDQTKEFENNDIYDWLVSPDDFYMESLKSFAICESDENVRNGQKLNINHYNELMLPIGMIKDKYFNSKSQCILSMKGILTEIDQLINNYYYGSMGYLGFYDNVSQKLVELINVFNNNFNLNGKMNDDEVLTLKFFQLYMLKYGLFDTIISLYGLFFNNNFIISKLETHLYENLIDKIFEILYQFSYKNSLILPIFFSKDIAELFLYINNQFADVKFRFKSYEINFYFKLLKMLRHMNLNLNLSIFLRLLFPLYEGIRDQICPNKKTGTGSKGVSIRIKGKSSGLRSSSKNIFELRSARKLSEMGSLNESKDIAQNFTGDYLMEKITEVINCANKCTRLSTPKSANINNDLILNIARASLTDKYFYQIWEKYKRSFNDESSRSLIEDKDDSQSIIGKTSDMIKQYGTLINAHSPITDAERNCVFSSFKLITKINDYTFYIVTDNIPKYDLKYLLEEKMNIMEPYERRLLSKVYSRYYVISPFNIFTKLYYSNVETMTKLADTNLNGKVIASSKEEMKEEANKHKIQKRESTKGLFGQTKVENVNLEADEKKEKIDSNNFFSGRAAFSFLKILKISEISLGLDPIFMNLSKYRRFMKLYINTYFKDHPIMFVKYFKDVIIYPSVFGIYKILYFTPTLNAKYKYLAYKLIYLFLECLKYFIETTLNDPVNFMHDERYKKELFDLFINENPKNEDMKAVMNDIKDKLAKDVPKIGKDPKFEPLKIMTLLEYLHKYLKVLKPCSFLPLILGGIDQNFQEDEKDEENEEEQEENPEDIKEFSSLVLYFVKRYEEEKTDALEESKDNILISYFTQEMTDDNTDLLQLKQNIALDLLGRIDFTKPKTEDYAKGKDEMFNLLNIINKIFKADPGLWHETIVEISHHTKQILNSIIKEHLTFLIQYIYIDYHKISPGKSTQESVAISKFLILLEYLRLHCENHHKIFQTILTNFNIIRRNPLLPGNQDGMDLLNFILKIPVIAMNNINYSQMRKGLVSLFRADNKAFFNDILTGITDYLIEIIQGSFERNMLHFSLSEAPGIASKDDEKGNDEKDKDKDKDKDKENENEENKIVNKDFDDYIEAGYLGFDNLGNPENEFFLNEFFRFIICFFDESLNPDSNKKKIISKFNNKKLLHGLSECNQKLYLKYERKHLVEELGNDAPLKVPDGFNEKLVSLYISNEEFKSDFYFSLASNIFRYFIIASKFKSAEKIRSYLKELKEDCKKSLGEIPEKSKDFIISKREVYKFFSQIVKDVEIYYKPKETMSELERRKFKDFFSAKEFDELEEDFRKINELKGDIQKVVYFVNPDSLFVNESDITAFMDSAPVEKNEKLNYLINYLPNFKYSIQMKKNLHDRNNKLLNLLYKINYQYACYFSIFLAVIVNIFILFSSFYDNDEYVAKDLEDVKDFNETIVEEDDEIVSRRRLLLEIPNYSTDYNNFMNPNSMPPKKFGYISFLEEGNVKNDTELVPATEGETAPTEGEGEAEVVWIRKEINQGTIMSLTILNLVFIIFIMINWFYFNSLKDDIIQKSENSDGQKQVSCFSSILNSLTKVGNLEIFPLLVNLLMGIAALLWVNYHFLYSIQLFTVFILFETMQTVIYSVKLRYSQFLSAGLLVIIVSLFFAMVKFYWFNSSGYCATFNECFLSIITDGIRGGSGMGFRTKKMNEQQFFSEFVFEWIFFFIIMLVLLNIINGIIVDTFQELREEANAQNETKMNICFICSLNRTLFERKGLDFEKHKESEHNILNYLHYIYKVLQTDESDLNSLDYQVLQSYRQARTDFFPVNTCITLLSQ